MKIRNYEFRKNYIFIINLIVILRISLNKDNKRVILKSNTNKKFLKAYFGCPFREVGVHLGGVHSGGREKSIKFGANQ